MISIRLEKVNESVVKQLRALATAIEDGLVQVVAVEYSTGGWFKEHERFEVTFQHVDPTEASNDQPT